jgi:hypothetical protein
VIDIKEKTPWGIVLNVLILSLAGVTSFFSSVGLIAMETVVEQFMPLASFAAEISVFLIMLGVIYFALAIYLWQFNELAWWLTVAIQTVGFIIGVSSIFVNPFIAMVVLTMQFVVLISLFHEDTIQAVRPNIEYPGWTLEE